MTLDQITEKKRFAGEKKPSMKRRSEINNYYGRHIYMLTLVVEGRRPLLGTLEGDEKNARVIPTPLGKEVIRCWSAIPQFHPEVKLMAFQLMPDHLHGLLFVREEMEKHLGQVVSGFKAGCNKIFRTFRGEAVPHLTAKEAVPHLTEMGLTGLTETGLTGLMEMGLTGLTEMGLTDPYGYAFEAAPPLPLPSECRLKKDDRSKGLLFERGYNDLIAKSYDMLPRMIAYISDNPRRLAVKRAHPDFFRVRFGIKLAGQNYAAIGNRFLLQHPEKVQVQLSRSLTEKQIGESVQYFLTLARQGAILVSPAISRGEQAVMRAALDEHLSLIFLTPWGFNKFSRPGHQYFEVCCEGRFLILAPWEHQNEKIPLTRTMCLTLNNMTKQICEL